MIAARCWIACRTRSSLAAFSPSAGPGCWSTVLEISEIGPGDSSAGAKENKIRNASRSFMAAQSPLIADISLSRGTRLALYHIY
jgi:hypothetical protein